MSYDVTFSCFLDRVHSLIKYRFKWLCDLESRLLQHIRDQLVLGDVLVN